MSVQKITAVVGAGFGDEGKGMAVDYLCRSAGDSLVVRHNGGAQAGHTVEIGSSRFVFHQLSSGSFRKADTFLAATFLPDLYKIEEEVQMFCSLSGFAPRIFSDKNAKVTIIDDVLLNMALETSRGDARHGSCGMGINEAVLRNEAGFSLTVGEASGMDHEALTAKLRQIRKEYVHPRMNALGLENTGEYSEMLKSGSVLKNAALGMLTGTAFITPAESFAAAAKDRENIVFEGAQGLLLDSEYTRFAPHLTSSRTGIRNPLHICNTAGLRLDETVYVMRSYRTRHGAGPFPGECAPDVIGKISTDLTNRRNPWQGSIRFGLYPSPEELAAAITDDSRNFYGSRGLFITHLNETDGFVRFAGEDIPAVDMADHPVFKGFISKLILSYTHFSDDCIQAEI